MTRLLTMAFAALIAAAPVTAHWNLLNTKVTIKGGVIVADKRQAR